MAVSKAFYEAAANAPQDAPLDFISAVEAEINLNGKAKNIIPLRVVCLSDVESKPVEWLWKPFLALGTFSLLEGEEGIGKTFLTCALACAVASGKGLPFTSEDEHIKPSNVLLISAEDSLSHVLKPRLEAMNAPTEKIFVTDEPFTLDADGIFRLSILIAETEAKLIIIDPLFSYVGRIKLNDDNDIRSVTDALKRLAEKHQCAIVGIRHIGKSKGFGDARNAGLNGIGWRASARSVLLVGKNPENETQKAICQTKNNLAPIYPKSIGFEIKDNQFFWRGESDLTKEAMLSAVKHETSEEKGERQDAIAFLREVLHGGERLSNEIQTEAKQNGISERTLSRAKTALGVHSRKEGFKPTKWFWHLVEDCREDCQKYKVGNLRTSEANKAIYSNNLAEDCQVNTSGNLRGNLREAEKEMCPTCERELDETPSGQKFCEVCFYTK